MFLFTPKKKKRNVNLLVKLIIRVIAPQKLTRSQSSWKGGSGSSFRSSFQEEAWKRYNRRMQEEYEEELERVVSSVLNFVTFFCCNFFFFFIG
jgi:hypothetical protein